MPLPKQHTYTSEDYWNLPDSQRAELIDGQLYNMAPPSRMHQRLVMELSATIRDYIRSHHGSCQVYPAPFAVNLDADDKDWGGTGYIRCLRPQQAHRSGLHRSAGLDHRNCIAVQLPNGLLQKNESLSRCRCSGILDRRSNPRTHYGLRFFRG